MTLTDERPREAPTVRLTCGNWQGDAYSGHHTGPCGSDGYVDVPAEHMLTGTWRQHIMELNGGSGWSVTQHHCRDPRDHEQNAGSRFHDHVHEMIFCCGPCHLSYLVHMYDANPRMQADVLMLAAGERVLENALLMGDTEP